MEGLVVTILLGVLLLAVIFACWAIRALFRRRPAFATVLTVLWLGASVLLGELIIDDDLNDPHSCGHNISCPDPGWDRIWHYLIVASLIAVFLAPAIALERGGAARDDPVISALRRSRG